MPDSPYHDTDDPDAVWMVGVEREGLATMVEVPGARSAVDALEGYFRRSFNQHAIAELRDVNGDGSRWEMTDWESGDTLVIEQD